jgi:hypothetical protein
VRERGESEALGWAGKRKKWDEWWAKEKMRKGEREKEKERKGEGRAKKEKKKGEEKESF